MEVKRVTAKGSVNIAIIKYWGKRDEKLILPLNDSVSITLDNENFFSCTTVAVDPSFENDRLWLNGKEQILNNRVCSCLKKSMFIVWSVVINCVLVRSCSSSQDLKSLHVHICSQNNFPTECGLASSASGFAALACRLYKIPGNCSDIARLGSGSACRSMYGGFVHWLKGIEEDGSDSIAKQIFPSSHWPDLRILILLVNGDKKLVGSTIGMKRSVDTSFFLHHRIQHCVSKRIDELINAIKIKNFSKFGEIAMKESNQLHAVCLDTYPPCQYLTDVSFSIINMVHAYNEYMGEVKLAYSFDAGPNAFLFVQKEHLLEICSLIKYCYPSTSRLLFAGFLQDDQVPNISCNDQIQKVLVTKIGDDIIDILDDNYHLLDSRGWPKVNCNNIL